MSTVQTIPISKLDFDETYQLRADLPTIDEYCEVFRGAKDDEWPFDRPMTVIKVGSKYKVIEGFTRGRAAKHVKRSTVEAVVIEGGHGQALEIALKANSVHGYRRTNSDKRKSVIRAIAEYPDRKPASIARLCAVSHTYVHQIFKELSAEQHVEPEPAEAAIVSLEPCPNCKANDWDESDGGHTCAVCRHPYGEPVGDQDEKPDAPTTAKRSKKKVKPGSTTQQEPEPTQPDPEPQPSGETVDDSGPKSKRGQMVNLDLDRVTAALSDIGRLIRSIDAMGMLDALAEPIDKINKALLAKKKKCQKQQSKVDSSSST